MWSDHVLEGNYIMNVCWWWSPNVKSMPSLLFELWSRLYDYYISTCITMLEIFLGSSIYDLWFLVISYVCTPIWMCEYLRWGVLKVRWCCIVSYSIMYCVVYVWMCIVFLRGWFTQCVVDIMWSFWPLYTHTHTSCMLTSSIDSRCQIKGILIYTYVYYYACTVYVYEECYVFL